MIIVMVGECGGGGFDGDGVGGGGFNGDGVGGGRFNGDGVGGGCFSFGLYFAGSADGGNSPSSIPTAMELATASAT